MLTCEGDLYHSETNRTGYINLGTAVNALVEDLISESIAAGEFDNLKGAGEPLPERRDFNPHTDPTTNKMNEILVETVGYSVSNGGSDGDRNVSCRVLFLTGFSFRKIFERGKFKLGLS